MHALHFPFTCSLLKLLSNLVNLVKYKQDRETMHKFLLLYSKRIRYPVSIDPNCSLS